MSNLRNSQNGLMQMTPNGRNPINLANGGFAGAANAALHTAGQAALAGNMLTGTNNTADSSSFYLA